MDFNLQNRLFFPKFQWNSFNICLSPFFSYCLFGIILWFTGRHHQQYCFTCFKCICVIDDNRTKKENKSIHYADAEICASIILLSQNTYFNEGETHMFEIFLEFLCILKPEYAVCSHRKILTTYFPIHFFCPLWIWRKKCSQFCHASSSFI